MLTLYTDILLVLRADPLLLKLVLLALAIIAIGGLLRIFHQPYVIAYITAGVLMGPDGLAVVTSDTVVSQMGEFGLILILFFIGLEMSLPTLVSNWRISVFGTLFQVGLSVLLAWIAGLYFAWDRAFCILIGFVISLSSSAVVIKILQENNQTGSKTGQNAISVLLAQDIIVIPMLLVINYMGGEKPDVEDVLLKAVGAILILGLILYIWKKRYINLPFQALIRQDHELQVFVAFVLCFGFSVITAFFGLSPALGAFVAGLLVAAARAVSWVQDSLNSFRVVFVALFFVSIGMLIDLNFVRENFGVAAILTLVIFLANNLINALIQRLMGDSWRNSFYVGAMLAQIGEFSFILASTGYAVNVIDDNGYKMAVSVIAISLFLSPFWIRFIKHLTRKK